VDLQAASLEGNDVKASSAPGGHDLKIVGCQGSQFRALTGVDCTEGRSIGCMRARLDLDEYHDIAV